MPRTATMPVGAMDQWVDWQVNAIPAWPAAMTATGGTATATNPTTPHAFATGDEVDVDDGTAVTRVILTVVDPSTVSWPAAAGAAAVTLTYVGDAQGGRRDAWTTQETLAAEVTSLAGPGTETIQADAVQATVVYRVRMWTVPIRQEDRLVWKGRILYVLGILRAGSLPMLILNCTEGNPT